MLASGTKPEHQFVGSDQSLLVMPVQYPALQVEEATIKTPGLSANQVAFLLVAAEWVPPQVPAC